MKTRITELLLVLTAAVLLGWGVVRTVNRGEPAGKQWTTYAMSGLVILAGVNLAVRSKALAGVILTVSAVLLLLVLAAALLSQADRTPHPTLAVVRSIVFLALLALTGLSQVIPTRPPVGTSRQDGSASANKTEDEKHAA